MNFLEYSKKNNVEISIFYRAMDNHYVFTFYYHKNAYRQRIELPAIEVEGIKDDIEKILTAQALAQYSLNGGGTINV